jgi:hypothetical protein
MRVRLHGWSEFEATQYYKRVRLHGWSEGFSAMTEDQEEEGRRWHEGGPGRGMRRVIGSGPPYMNRNEKIDFLGNFQEHFFVSSFNNQVIAQYQSLLAPSVRAPRENHIDMSF